jgi:hypothetical protein
MFYLALGLCAFVCTVALVRFLHARTRLSEQDMEALIGRKLRTSNFAKQLNHLQEENAVMRNLLKDFVENEASVAVISRQTPLVDKSRLLKARELRRREIFGEAIHLLDAEEKAKAAAMHVTS